MANGARKWRGRTGARRPGRGPCGLSATSPIPAGWGGEGGSGRGPPSAWKLCAQALRSRGGGRARARACGGGRPPRRSRPMPTLGFCPWGEMQMASSPGPWPKGGPRRALGGPQRSNPQGPLSHMREAPKSQANKKQVDLTEDPPPFPGGQPPPLGGCAEPSIVGSRCRDAPGHCGNSQARKRYSKPRSGTTPLHRNCLEANTEEVNHNLFATTSVTN